VVFKSKKYAAPISSVGLNNLSASLLFSNPQLAGDVAANTSILVKPSEENNSPHIDQSGDQQRVEQRLVVDQFEYIHSGDGVYVADIQAPLVDGEYEIITVIDYQDEALPSKEIKLITLIDPEGYIYEKTGHLETRIAGAVASIYWLNPNTDMYELWQAREFQQENPQITDMRGTYSFLVPAGFYYIKVDAPGYMSYESKPFEVKEGSGVHMNIELKTRYWLLKVIDWKTVLLLIVFLLLGYNFYKDKMREKKI
jgi:hypothetical protein